MQGINLDYILGDIRDFRCPYRVVMAGCYIDSLTHLTTNEDIIRHFRNMRANMQSGGIYIIQLCHPRYFFPATEPNIWTERRGRSEVETLYGLPDDSYDTVSQVWDLTTRLTLKEDGRIVDFVERTVKHRFYLCQELKALIELSGAFDDWAFYSELSLPADTLKHESKGKSMVAVLRFK